MKILLEQLKLNINPSLFMPCKKGEGFTLLELIGAIFVMTVGVLGAYTVVQQIIIYTSISSSRLTAAYLAKEGIEIVRNIRDTNWLEGVSWNNGLEAGDWEVDYTTQQISDTYDGDFLNIGGNGFYSYSSGTPTKFKRKITISFPENKLKVLAKIEWTEKGKDYEVVVEEHLYDWY